MKIHANYLERNGRKFFRGGAEDIDFASFGEKKTPLGKMPYLAVHGHVARPHLERRVRCMDVVRYDWSQEKKGDFESYGNFKFYGANLELGLTASYDVARSMSLTFVKFFIYEDSLIKMLNDDAFAARKYLAEEGADGRIVSQLWVVVAGEVATKIQTTAAATASVSKSGHELELSLDASSQSSERLVLRPGTAIAYATHRVSDWTDHKTVIKRVDDDYLDI